MNIIHKSINNHSLKIQFSYEDFEKINNTLKLYEFPINNSGDESGFCFVLIDFLTRPIDLSKYDKMSYYEHEFVYGYNIDKHLALINLKEKLEQDLKLIQIGLVEINDKLNDDEIKHLDKSLIEK